MDFINDTTFPSLLFRGSLNDDVTAMSAIAKIAYTINENGKSHINYKIDYSISPSPGINEFGPYDGEYLFKKGGIDLIIYGYSRPEKMVRQSKIDVIFNDKLINRLIVFGNRKWKKHLLGMQMSAPELYQELQLNYYNAFGGKTIWEGMELPHPLNANGKGYVMEESMALETELPNIEDPENLITGWNDHPIPTGIGQMPFNSYKAKLYCKPGSDNDIEVIDPKIFNSAFPKMILDKVETGDVVKVEGVLPGRDFIYELPETKLFVEIKLGEKVYERKMNLDTIELWPDKGTAFLTFRYPVKYNFTPMQLRQCKILNK